MARFKKGSAEAKRYMARLRAMVGRKKRKSLSSKTSHSPVRRRKMARRRYARRRRKGGMTIPLAPVTGLIAGFITPSWYGKSAVQWAMEGDIESALKTVVNNYTGYRIDLGQWKPEGLAHGVAPIVAGLLVHKFVGGAPLNLNRLLGRAKVPFIRM